MPAGMGWLTSGNNASFDRSNWLTLANVPGTIGYAVWSTDLQLWAASVQRPGHPTAIYTSPDANEWTIRLPGNLFTIRWTGSVFVAWGSTGLYVSVDGVTWADRTPTGEFETPSFGSSVPILAVAGKNDHLVVIAFDYKSGWRAVSGIEFYESAVLGSSDAGVTWGAPTVTPHDVASPIDFQPDYSPQYSGGSSHTNNQQIAGDIVVGGSWRATLLTPLNPALPPTYINPLATSSDGDTWTFDQVHSFETLAPTAPFDPAPYPWITGLATDGTVWVGIGAIDSTHFTLALDSGSGFTPVHSADAVGWVGYLNSRFVGADGAKLSFSVDGSEWTDATVPGVSPRFAGYGYIDIPGVPPQRQFPRDDGLGISTRRSWPPNVSQQHGLRRGTVNTYQ